MLIHYFSDSCDSAVGRGPYEDIIHDSWGRASPRRLMKQRYGIQNPLSLQSLGAPGLSHVIGHCSLPPEEGYQSLCNMLTMSGGGVSGWGGCMFWIVLVVYTHCPLLPPLAALRTFHTGLDNAGTPFR